MSVTKALIEQNRTKKSVSSSGRKDGSRLYTYKPTDNHKQAIRGGNFGVSVFLRIATGLIERKCTITFGGREDSDNVYVMVRERTDDWRDARCVSVWHRDLERAMAGMAYYLSEVNQDFPEGVGPLDSTEYDW